MARRRSSTTYMRPCLECGKPSPNPRCAEHERHQTPEWKARSKILLKAWREKHGNWCPGYARAPHSARDLTVHHQADGTLSVLCRSCNTRAG